MYIKVTEISMRSINTKNKNSYFFNKIRGIHFFNFIDEKRISTSFIALYLINMHFISKKK